MSKRVIDFARVQAALDRAAHNAMYGSREDKSGMFFIGDRAYELMDFGEGPGDEAKAPGTPRDVAAIKLETE